MMLSHHMEGALYPRSSTVVAATFASPNLPLFIEYASPEKLSYIIKGTGFYGYENRGNIG